MQRSRGWGAIVALVAMAAAVDLDRAVAFGAENFACGDGAANAKTQRCDCPKGKVEKTVGGTSRCVVAPPPPVVPKPPPSASSSAPPLPTCAPSQIPSPAGCIERCAPDATWTGGACEPRCGPRQDWDGTRCVASSGDVGTACTDGRVADAIGHCCFAGQVWAEESQRCRGRPACPTGLVVEGESCVARCDDGRSRVGGDLHCCWPGQDWSFATSACVGVASCPAGFDADGDGCIASFASIPSGDSSGASTDAVAADEPAPPLRDAERYWGSQRVELSLMLGVERLRGDATATIAGYAMAYHFDAIPVLLRGAFFVGRYRLLAPDCGSATSCVGDSRDNAVLGGELGVYLAPLSWPHPKDDAVVSLFNPYVGVNLVGQSFYRSPDDHLAPRPPAGSFAAVATLGDSIFLMLVPHKAALALAIDYGTTMIGSGARPDARWTFTGSIVGF